MFAETIKEDRLVGRYAVSLFFQVVIFKHNLACMKHKVHVNAEFCCQACFI